MLGAKFTDLFLAEKNLIDFVDKNLGQEWDRLKQNELEMDSVCRHLAGGSLDYPIMISHDFCDITTAWDIYLYAFTKDVRAIMPKKFGFGINEKLPVKNERWGKMPFRGDELTPKQFVTAVCHCGVKIRTHIVDCTMEVTQTGRLENLYPIISNVVVIRNYLWMFGELFDTEVKNKLRPEYKEFCDLVEVISEQMLQVQANLLLTFIVHDEDSQDWESHHVYYEGERGSPTVQMWSYFLRSMQRDMWKIMPPQLAQRIFGIIVSDSLGVLVGRYTKIRPSESSIPHFACDIINILATVEELLFYIASDLSLLCGEEDATSSRTIYSIHLKCESLVTSLVMVGCPFEILYKSFRRGLSSCTLLERRLLEPSKVLAPTWMEIIRHLTPSFYPDGLSYEDWELLCTLKLVCSQPDVKWALVYRVLSMQEGKIASFILNLFPTVVAPVSDFMLEGKSFQRCGNASCLSQECHSLAKSLPNHFASACTLYIVAHAMPRTSFVKVFRPVLQRIVDWSVMDRTQMWSSKSRPVWFQSMIDLLLPILKSCVQSLCLTVIGMPGTVPHTEETFTQLVIELLNGLTEMLSVIPRGFFLVCEEMDDMIPPNHHPIRNNVHLHFLVTALYMLLNLGPKIAYIPPSPPPVVGCNNYETPAGTSASVAKGTSTLSNTKKEPSDIVEPVLLSVAERLCHLDDPAFDQAVHRLVTQIESMMKHMHTSVKAKEPQIPLQDYAMEWDLSQLKADVLLQEVEGQLALRVAYWFMVTHGDLLQKVIAGEVNPSGSPKESVRPSNAQTEKHPPSAMLNPGPTELGRSNSRSGSARTKATNSVKESKNPAASSSSSSSYGAKINLNLVKVAPRICTYVKAQNVIHDFHYVNKYRIFDEILWNYEQNVNWVQVVRCSKLGLHKALILKQLERRWEFRLGEDESVSSGAGLTPDKKNSLNKMVEEIKALMMA